MKKIENFTRLKNHIEIQIHALLISIYYVPYLCDLLCAPLEIGIAGYIFAFVVFSLMEMAINLGVTEDIIII